MVDDELGLAMVFNGCIYNYQQLREELRGYGYRFFSTSDTEVILKAYHRWGADCVEHFLGHVRVRHRRARPPARVMLARDRLGIKPLYLAETPGRLRFASTLPALLAAGDVDTAIDPVALHHYMTLPLGGARAAHDPRRRPQAAAGHRADDHSRTAEHRRPVYWAAGVHPGRRPRPCPPTTGRRRFMAALRTAVERRMVADVPVGVLLSGGLDSSLIVALLAEQGQRGLTTFSIGFEAAAGESGDEFALLRPHRQAVRHRPPPDPDRHGPVPAGRGTHASRR